MKGYAVRVDELEKKSSGDMLFVMPKQTEREYPLPAAFGAYADYLQIRLGQEKYRETEGKT